MSRAGRRRYESEDEETSSTYEDDDLNGLDYDVFGNLKTQIIWDPKEKHTCVALRQYAETPRRLEFKFRGLLNTVTGRQRTWGHVRKNFYTDVPSLQRLMENNRQRQRGGRLDEPDLDPEAWVPCGLRTLFLRDWTIAPGLAFDSAQPAHPLRYTLSVRKNPQVLKSSDKVDLWLSAKSIAEVDARSMQMTAGVGLRLKLFRYRLTNKQDLKVSAGLDWDVLANGSRVQRTPYLKVSESNFGVKLQRGQWSFIYEV